MLDYPKIPIHVKEQHHGACIPLPFFNEAGDSTGLLIVLIVIGLSGVKEGSFLYLQNRCECRKSCCLELLLPAPPSETASL